MDYDGKLYEILAQRSENTAFGSVWRLVTNQETLVLVLFPTSKSVAGVSGLVIESVSSVLGAVSRLAYDVLEAYMPQEGEEDADALPLPQWGAYAKAKLDEGCKDAERRALGVIQDRNERWNGSKLKIGCLRDLRDWLFDLALRHEDDVNCPHQGLASILWVWEEFAGSPMREKVVSDYDERMRLAIDSAARQMAEETGVAQEDAVDAILRGTQYVAELLPVSASGLETRLLLPLRSATITAHDEQDKLLLSSGLSPANERGPADGVSAVSEESSSALRREYPDGPLNRREAAGLLGIGLSTLDKYARRGIIPKHKPPGTGKPFFYAKEIIEAISKYGISTGS